VQWSFCGTLIGLVLTRELLRVCLVLKTVLMLYLFTVHLNFSEAPLTYGMDINQSGLTLFFRGIFLFDLSITELINQMG
jgi:hypothetical protein